MATKKRIPKKRTGKAPIEKAEQSLNLYLSAYLKRFGRKELLLGILRFQNSLKQGGYRLIMDEEPQHFSTEIEVMPFGKYKDLTFKKILKRDPQYLIWLDSNVSSVNISASLLTKAKVAWDKQMESEADEFQLIPEYEYN